MSVQSGFYPLMLIYLAFFTAHFYSAKVHKFFLAKDIYLIPEQNRIRTVDDDNKEEFFELKEIIKATYKFGLVQVKLSDQRMLYFFIKEKSNLTILTDHLQRTR